MDKCKCGYPCKEGTASCDNPSHLKENQCYIKSCLQPRYLIEDWVMCKHHVDKWILAKKKNIDFDVWISQYE